jgi:RNase H-fold protein (predicted Holliday junction resolvase)
MAEEKEAFEKEIKSLKGKVKNVEELVSDERKNVAKAKDELRKVKSKEGGFTDQKDDGCKGSRDVRTREENA